MQTNCEETRIFGRADRPASATGRTVAVCGFLGFLASFALVWALRPFAATEHNAMLLLGGTAFSVLATDVVWAKVHRRPSTGLDFSRWSPSLGRTLVKFVG